MATYDTICQKCEHTWEQVHLMREEHAPCPKCGGKARTVISLDNSRINPPADMFWENEGRGLGRYIPQLETDTRTRSKDAFCRSRGELIEKAKRRGWEVFR